MQRARVICTDALRDMHVDIMMLLGPGRHQVPKPIDGHEVDRGNQVDLAHGCPCKLQRVFREICVSWTPEQ